MMIVALLIGCLLAKDHAWKAFLLCLIAGIEIVALQPFTDALGGHVRLAAIRSDIILGTGSLTLLFFAGRVLRWVFLREAILPSLDLIRDDWRESEVVKPLFYVGLAGLGMTLFAAICLSAPTGAVIKTPSPLSLLVGCVGLLLLWRLLSWARYYNRHRIPAVVPFLAVAVIAFAMTDTDFGDNKSSFAPKPGSAGNIYRGHFATATELPSFEDSSNFTVGWATVGDNWEVWRAKSGKWINQGYNVPGKAGGAGPFGIATATDDSFVVPAVGAAVRIRARMPWVDPEDTVNVTDGIRRFKGKVLANTGTAISVVNCEAARNGTGTIAAGAVVSLCGDFDGKRKAFYQYDDFLSLDGPTSAAVTWSYIGENGISKVSRQSGRLGVVSFASGTKSSVDELIANRGVNLRGVDFGSVRKCVVRWIVSCDGTYSSRSFDGEWYVGIGNPDGTGNMNGGALLSFAPGFPANGLLAGSYTSTSSHTETETPFKIANNTWYDLVISWTPTVIKYYAAVYGSTPELIATNTTNISTLPQFPLAGNNRYLDGNSLVTLFVDKVEWFYETSGGAPADSHTTEPSSYINACSESSSCSRMWLSHSRRGSKDLKSLLSLLGKTVNPLRMLPHALDPQTEVPGVEFVDDHSTPENNL